MFWPATQSSQQQPEARQLQVEQSVSRFVHASKASVCVLLTNVHAHRPGHAHHDTNRHAPGRDACGLVASRQSGIHRAKPSAAAPLCTARRRGRGGDRHTERADEIDRSNATCIAGAKESLKLVHASLMRPDFFYVDSTVSRSAKRPVRCRCVCVFLKPLGPIPRSSVGDRERSCRYTHSQNLLSIRRSVGS